MAARVSDGGPSGRQSEAPTGSGQTDVGRSVPGGSLFLFIMDAPRRFGGSEKKDKDKFYLGIKGNVDLTVEYKPGDHCYMYLEYEVYCALLRNFGSTFRNINIWR